MCYVFYYILIFIIKSIINVETTLIINLIFLDIHDTTILKIIFRKPEFM